MNHQIASKPQEHVSLSQKRLRSVAIGKIQKSIKILMITASFLRLDYIHGFFFRGVPFVHKSLFHVRSSTVMSTTSSIGSRNSMPSIRRSSSLLTSPKSTSSCIGKIQDDEYHSISLAIPTMEIMEEVGALIAILSKRTDVIFLDGDLGAGKTTFSRGFIKCKLGIVDDCSEDEESENIDGSLGARVQQASLRITSPTYLLSNTYEYEDDDEEEGISQTRE